MHRVHHLLVLVRPRHGQNAGMALGDHIGFCAKAAGHDHLAVLVDRLADSVEAFGSRRIQEPARVHQNKVRALVVRRDLIALSSQAGDDAL